MPLTAKQLGTPATLTDAEAAYYEVLAPIVTTIIERFVACNFTDADHLLTVWLVPRVDAVGDPGVPGDDNVILREVLVEGKTAANAAQRSSTRECSELRQQIMKRGDKIYAKADANDVITIHGTGLELKVPGQT